LAEKQAEADAALQDITASMQVIVHSLVFLHTREWFTAFA
jgi:hypothetical protein